MAGPERYSMKVGNIGQQELDLLECLLRVDREQVLDSRADDMLERLVEAGLVDDSAEQVALTPAGVERCQSLQHRIAGDKEAAKVLADRGIVLSDFGRA